MAKWRIPTIAIWCFGRESRGLDERWMERFASACVRIPMRDGMRSLNLSNAVAIAAVRGFAAKLVTLIYNSVAVWLKREF